MSQPALLPGFEYPVADSQHAFRAILKAFSNPGSIQRVEALPQITGWDSATQTVCYTLLDEATPLWFDSAMVNSAQVKQQIAFHCAAPIVQTTQKAQFAQFFDGNNLDLNNFNWGSESYPDQSCTLILQVSALKQGEGWRLTGPGIKNATLLKVEGLPGHFLSQWAANQAAYPLGVDVILTAGDELVALPRTVSIEE